MEERVLQVDQEKMVDRAFLAQRVPRDLLDEQENLDCQGFRVYLEQVARMVYQANKDRWDKLDHLENLDQRDTKEGREYPVSQDVPDRQEQMEKWEIVGLMVYLAHLVSLDFWDFLGQPGTKDPLVSMDNLGSVDKTVSRDKMESLEKKETKGKVEDLGSLGSKE